MAKIYIAGPMRGLPEFNYPAFNDMAERLRGQGHKVFNPAESFEGNTGREFYEYMRADVKMLMKSDYIYLLDGWQNSEGARLEYQLAKALGMAVFNIYRGDEPVELEAARIVRNGEREASYGHPGKDFARTGQYWGVEPQVVALRMIQLKISRLIATPTHRDSIVDLIGYAICYARIMLEGNSYGS